MQSPRVEGGDYHSEEEELEAPSPIQRQLPDDLPKSLDDRRVVPNFDTETEMYDAWQGTWFALRPSHRAYLGRSQTKTTLLIGQSQFLTSPVPAKPLTFNLALDEPSYEDEPSTHTLEDSDNRLMEMLAAQAAHREDGSAAEDEDDIINNTKLDEGEKRDMLQKVLNMAASNGDVDRVKRLVNGKARTMVNIDAPDEEGTAPLIYASCFVGARAICLGVKWLTTR